MGEVLACIAVGFVLGYLIGGAMAFDKGFKAGMSWAMNKWSGHS